MAQTSGKIRGTIILVAANGETIGCSTNATLTIDNEPVEDTCKDDNGAQTFSPGAQTWGLEFEGITIFTTSNNFRRLAQAALDQEILVWTMGSDNPDDPVFTGEGFLGNFTYNAPLNEPSTWSASVSPTGPLSMDNT